jgi:predicted nucleic acid-binding protein
MTIDSVRRLRMAERTMLFDAGVWIASQDFDDSYYESACELVFDSRRGAAAMDLTLYEILNGILRRWRDPEKAVDVCRSATSRCQGRLVRIDLELLESIVSIASEHRLTSYDATYVAVARSNDWTLVSTDIRDLVSKGLAITPDAAV